MFNKLLSEKNRYILVNLIFTLVVLIYCLLNIALLKEHALDLISLIFNSVKEKVLLVIFLIVASGGLGVYLIIKLINQKVIINGSLVYISIVAILIHLFNLSLYKEYFNNMSVDFSIKFTFIVSYIILGICGIYSLYVILRGVWRIIKPRLIDFDAPKIIGKELQSVAGLYYLDFDYNKNLTYYVTYESNGKVIKEDLTNKQILCLVGDLLPKEEYEIKLHCLGKLKSKLTSLTSNESIKLTLEKEPSIFQKRIAEYYHYNKELIECYISILQIFDKMFKRLLIYTPEVMIIESINKKLVFAKIYLDKENIVVRFNANPYLLEGDYKVINSFEEDCMYPTKYIVRNLSDVEYMKKIVDKIKNIKK